MSTSIKSKQINDQALGSNLFRQSLINGNFDVWQRGTSVALADATTAYQADRWFDYHQDDGGTLPTLTRSKQVLTSGALDGSYYYSRLTTNGAGTSLGNATIGEMVQKIENGTSKLCGNGKKVTVSFWARSDIANKRLGLWLSQFYGTGGSPTSPETINGTNFTLTSTWTKYTYTFTTNTLSGKTFGTAGDEALQIYFYYAWGDTYKAFSGSASAETYVGSGNIDIAQVQLCAGDVALPFMPKSFEEELRACQRYYQQTYDDGTAPGTNTLTGVLTCYVPTTNVVFGSEFKCAMRIVPVVTLYSKAGTINKITKEDAATDIGTSVTAGTICKSRFMNAIDSGAGFTAAKNYHYQYTANAEL